MRRLLIPLLITALLLGAGAFALNRADAAPPAQGTATPGATATARTTSTPRATATARASATPRATVTIEATATVTDSDTVTGTEEITATASVTNSAIITGTVLPARLSALPEDVNAGRTLTVVGHGEVAEIPNAATIMLGVDTMGPDIEAATEENNDRIDAILEVIEELDIPDRNVQTGSYNIYIERQQQPIEPGPASSESGEALTDTLIYHVSQQIQVRVENLGDNLDLVSDLIEQAVEAGANNVFGPNFQLDDDRALQQRARRAAVEDAYIRAQDWAALTGVEIIGVASVSEVIGGGGPQPFPAADEAALGGGPSLQPGELSYSQQVQVVFYIR